MKRNIWLALLCLSGGLSQSVMGSENTGEANLRKFEELAGMNAEVLSASDLTNADTLIASYRKSDPSSTYAAVIEYYRNEIERKIKEKQKNVDQFAGAVKNPGGQNAQGENSSVADLTDAEKQKIRKLSSAEIQNITADDLSELGNFLEKPITDDYVTLITDIQKKKEEFDKKRKEDLQEKVEVAQPVIAKVEDKQPAEKPVEQVTKEQITEDIKEFGRLNQMWIRRQGSMKPEEKARFMELLNKNHIAKNCDEGILQRYKTEISKSLNDGSVPDADRIQNNQLAQKNAPESAPEGPQNNVNRQQPQQNLGDEQEEDVLGTFAAFVKDTEEGKGSKSKKERQIKKQLSEVSAEVIDDDAVDIDKKVSKLNGLFDLFPIKNKKKQTSVILNQIKIAARKSNAGGDKFFKRGQAFDLFWKFCATTPAKERTNALFNAACVRNEDEFIEFMTTRLSTDKSSQAQLKTLGEFLINIKNTLNEDLEKKLMDVVFENVLKIEEASEDVSEYINQKVQKDDQKEYKDVLKMLTNGKAFFEKEIKDIEKAFKKWEDEDDLDSLLNKADDIIAVLSHFGKNKIISQKDKETLTKKSERLTKKISEEQGKVSE